ncbi:MAG: hypothetical protein O8C61_02325 [Candidatus Methanoperedens sp.]|nr:hypothetical protein [Candidatus Methanoperedens sp.]
MNKRTITTVGVFLLLLADLDVARAAYGISNGIDISGTIVRLISFLLGMCGATYLAAGLWQRAEKGSETWKYLSISMVLFVFWNVIMAFGILLDVLTAQRAEHDIAISVDALNTYYAIVRILDPVLEVIVFVILLFGLRKIINAMRNEPWSVFSKEDSDE